MDSTRLNAGDTVIILGSGGFAVELAGLLEDVGVTVRGCIAPEAPSGLSNLIHLGVDDSLVHALNLPVIVAIGEPELRSRIFHRIAERDGRAAAFIHPSAYVSSQASIAEGAIVYPNATVHANVSLGRGVVINSNATIGHETVLGGFVNIGPGATVGGKVTIGDGAYIGIGACIIERVAIAARSVLGAGAVAIRDCVPEGTYIGVPARRRL